VALDLFFFMKKVYLAAHIHRQGFDESGAKIHIAKPVKLHDGLIIPGQNQGGSTLMESADGHVV
jgi:hypothetical protein